MARLTAWSLSIAAEGIAPEVGFHEEAFEKSSYRFAMRGKQLADGWKKLCKSSIIICSILCWIYGFIFTISWETFAKSTSGNQLFFLVEDCQSLLATNVSAMSL